MAPLSAPPFLRLPVPVTPVIAVRATSPWLDRLTWLGHGHLIRLDDSPRIFMACRGGAPSGRPPCGERALGRHPRLLATARLLDALSFRLFSPVFLSAVVFGHRYCGTTVRDPASDAATWHRTTKIPPHSPERPGGN